MLYCPFNRSSHLLLLGEEGGGGGEGGEGGAREQPPPQGSSYQSINIRSNIFRNKKGGKFVCIFPECDESILLHKRISFIQGNN